MILHSLARYHERLTEEGGIDIAPEGFERKEIPFIITLNEDGNFLELLDTRDGEGKVKRGRIFTVPHSVKKTSGIAANLLWDTPNYVVGIPKLHNADNVKKYAELAAKQHQCFITTIKQACMTCRSDEGINAVLTYLEKGDFASLLNHPLWQEAEEKSLNITFKLDKDDVLVCQRSAVIQVINESISEENTTGYRCLVTGSLTSPKRLHSAIKGIRGAQSSGANIVSFNLDSFSSYGKKQGMNAPVSSNAEFAYTTALNHLLSRDSRQKILIGDATTVFWTAKNHPFENAFFTLFGQDSSKGDEEQDYKNLIALFRSPESGHKTNISPETKFYVLGLAPNAARIAVRFWYSGTVQETAEKIWQHFDDLEIVKGQKEWRTIGLRWLLRATALQEKDDNIPPNLAGDTMKAVLNGTPYPRTLLAAAVRRCRAEQSVTYPRAALIKAVLVRETRYFQKNTKEVCMSLDISNSNPGYLMGRLFAVLERTQEAANPGINSTIRDRFYGAASAIPATAFPQLMKLKNHHISKIDNKGQAVNLERLIGEIIEKITAGEGFPAHLSLQNQGRFAIGYYH
ncbi:MAG: type I-C CRISPR-associated protein Cas8c/Csd1, partial [Dehalococcoidales bacterium]|nr:type I-C CRISPR-associated protein Cas8c/Csd1 [Dehalococcoidales bacterium]